MSEETHTPENEAAMDSAEFEAKLTEFFTRHKESKLRLVPRIVKEFKGQEQQVLEHLHNKYVLRIVTEKPTKKHAVKSQHTGGEEGHHEETPVDAKPKSKKKLILISAISVIVAGLGAGGFFLKDKLMGKHEEPAKTETASPAEGQPTAEEPKKEEAPAPPETTAQPADTLQGAIPPDSASAENPDTTAKSE